MEPTRSCGAGSGNSGTYSPEISETLRFEEEIQSLMRDNNLVVHPNSDSPPVNGSSFTALLRLPPNQAVELLHDHESGHSPTLIAAVGDMWRFRPTFPSNAVLVDRAARFSVFAAEDLLETESNSGVHSPPNPKAEPSDSGDRLICSIPIEKTQRLTVKRKEEGEKSKVKGPAKKSKSGEERNTKTAVENTGAEKLPYVHVRARRGQATDSHSLAERARREKINARMKLLQELVPGCSKISGTALVLDEIINHVQTLQRQVEFLSMRLAAVNPRIDFSGLDNILSAECGRLTVCNGRSAVGLEQSPWADGTTNGGRRQQQQIWHVDPVQSDNQQQETVWERDDTHNHVFISPPGTASIFCYDSANSVSLSNQLKSEL